VKKFLPDYLCLERIPPDQLGRHVTQDEAPRGFAAHFVVRNAKPLQSLIGRYPDDRISDSLYLARGVGKVAFHRRRDQVNLYVTNLVLHHTFLNFLFSVATTFRAPLDLSAPVD